MVEGRLFACLLSVSSVLSKSRTGGVMVPPSSVAGRCVPALYSPGDLYSIEIEVTADERINDRIPACRSTIQLALGALVRAFAKATRAHEEIRMWSSGRSWSAAYFVCSSTGMRGAFRTCGLLRGGRRLSARQPLGAACHCMAGIARSCRRHPSQQQRHG
ncbi:hypothetical protein XAP6164_2320017 [Xanthomonas phaseoli pv. phaseoli]|nr:hypothetical protein XAP6164_2320017 [Xanthomonas phaseoli pv. phaseoli]